jgi:glyceraldehyde 3-phosphate dehydrogenase
LRRRVSSVFYERDPAAIDWESVGAEIVIRINRYLYQGLKTQKSISVVPSRKVIISAPGKEIEDITIVLGV